MSLNTGGGPIEILLVEDDADAAEMMCSFLQSEGFKIQWAGTVQQAIEMLRYADHSPDLILLDLTLPDREGTDVVLAVGDSARPLPPIVVASGRPDAELRAAASMIGAAAIAQKPYSPAKMIDTITGLLGSR